MTTEQDTLARAQSLADQHWRAFKAHLPDLERIAAEGPNDSERDQLIVRAVFHGALGDIRLRECEIAEIENPTPKGEPKP